MTNKEKADLLVAVTMRINSAEEALKHAKAVVDNLDRSISSLSWMKDRLEEVVVEETQQP